VHHAWCGLALPARSPRLARDNWLTAVKRVKEVRTGKASAFGLAVVALCQLVTPFTELDWALKHTACFLRDPPYTTYTTGCSIIQLFAVAMLLNAVVGVLVADSHGRRGFLVSFVRAASAHCPLARAPSRS
jgi:hypothetical protein